MPVKPGFLLFAGGGGIIAYCGVTGKSPTGALRALLGGASPSTAPSDPSLAIANYGYAGAAAAGAGGQGGAAIVAKAMSFVGHKYVFGGPSNPNTGWDCSSFASYILGQCGYGVPGGSWAKMTNNGNSHGPVAGQYMTWSGATTVAKSAVTPGCLLVWPTHVGFAVDANHMISAFTTAQGTIVTGWDGPTGEPGPLVRSVNGAASGGPVGNINNRTDFANALLTAMSDPTSAANVSSIVAWEVAEGGNWNNSAKFNPLNTTMPESGSSNIASAEGHIQAYSSWESGVTATAATINNGNYPNIVMHLKAGTGLLTGCAADFAKWGTITSGL
jgi:hypothetical protein